jgi:hypothetical protein
MNFFIFVETDANLKCVQRVALNWDHGDRAKRARLTHVENVPPSQWMDVNIFQVTHRENKQHLFIGTDASSETFQGGAVDCDQGDKGAECARPTHVEHVSPRQ